MNVTYKTHKPARVVEETFDTQFTMQMADGSESPNVITDNDCPIYYIVKVQVRVWFFWITIWEKHCDISDGDTRQHIINEANQLLKTLEGQEDE